MTLRINHIGIETLTAREVGRFMKVYVQTVLSPLVTTVLFCAIFMLGMPSDGTAHKVLGVPFLAFLSPGLVMMSMAQNAFANTSSSIVIAKVQGTINDTLMAPLSAGDLLTGYLTGAVARGVLVGVVSMIGLAFFAPMGVHDLLSIMAFGLVGCVMMGALGVLSGLWSTKFDHIAAVTNFIITPLTFLSGTFYSLDRLPSWLSEVAHYNPIFHMIDGFRYGFIGTSDAPVMDSLLVLVLFTLALVWLCHHLLHIGYRLKS